MNKPSGKSDNDKQEISTASHPIDCKHEGCGELALSLSKYCWDHMPDEEKAKYKQKIEDWHKKGNSLKGFNLQNAKIPKIHLENADLSEANFFRSKLPDSFLSNANLENANLEEANLSGSDLSGANLSEALLGDAHLVKSVLIKANLSKSDSRRANISDADLRNSNITNTCLNYSNLSGSDFRGANLTKSFIQYANLSFAKFGKANLINTDLRNSKLIKADLVGANLSNAKLNEADFSESFVAHAKLLKANCRLAKFIKADLASSTLIETNFHDTDLSEARFWNAKLDNAIFRGADLTKAKGLRMSLFTKELSEIEKNNPEIYQESYLFIKNYFLRMGPTDDASEAAFREKTLQRLSYSKIFWQQMEEEYRTNKLEIKKVGIRKLFQRLKYIFSHPFLSLKTFIKIFLWKLFADSCGYGEKPWLTMRATVQVIGIFALYYWVHGKFGQSLHWWESIYFSVVTFTTLGLGDIIPLTTSWGTRIAVASEAFFGALMIALFVWTLARKGAAR
jgi:uncharacterized protein YjbI with pentapeptide repeats